jgi:C-terminal processing protease CtpA/Prc
MRFFLLFAFLAVSTYGSSQAQSTPKPIGMTISATFESFLKAKVAKLLVTAVAANSQAEAAGLVVGDEIIKVDGIDIPGKWFFELMPLQDFTPGKAKLLTLKRADGTQYEARLVK